ncbi:hypothetical protein ACPOL_5963 [Acidisarcina polymorpha]|uniref:N-acetyltransferase domain-containing protein n=1 Tax=Acidisarcina polymorpha TaxID=2211140 RepID=A0A2Z5G8T9_9BACT|nr:GNAT family N-acetyltransferase [Acidisarcina polymorpha]AXC15207.1 hypothetical protein ACPOL_5963 [Acidisarcina polymorpha]
MSADFPVKHNEPQSRFEVLHDEGTSVLDYEQTGGQLVLVHTGVPPPLQGQGIASSLAKAAVEYARSQGIKIVPQCPFVAAYVERHPEYVDLVDAKRPAHLA